MSTPPVKSDQLFLGDMMGNRMATGLNRQELYAFFCVCLTFFISFMAPSVTSNDAGELGAAAFELGVAHPPGFPVFTILLNGLIQNKLKN